ncbi:MAG: hypothetical protein R6U21_06235 [Thermoplasmatota archaeon]
MEVIVEFPQKEKIKKVFVDKNETIESVVKQLGYHVDAVVVLCNQTPIPETTEITNNMKVSLLEVTSKG